MNFKKWMILNLVISVAAFCFIFYSCAGVSGGDIAIGIYIVFSGILQAIGILLLTKKAKAMRSSLLLGLLLTIFTELFVLVKWGYAINEWVKHSVF
jgi:hypothetical protein